MPAFDIDVQELEELIEEALNMRESIQRVTVQNLENLGQYARLLAKVELEDTRYTGVLERSFVVETRQAEIEVRVFPTAHHAIYVRMGTRPHWAPIGPLKKWAAAKLGDERLGYPVQQSIAKHGTSMYQARKRGDKSNPWPRRVIERSDFQSAIQKTMQETAVDIVTEFVT